MIIRFIASGSLASVMQYSVDWIMPIDTKRILVILVSFLAAIIWYPIDSWIRGID